MAAESSGRSDDAGPAFAKGAWTGWDLTLVFGSSIAAFWLADYLIVIALAVFRNGGFASVAELYTYLRAAHGGASGFWTPGTLALISAGRSAAALLVVYALRGCLPIKTWADIGLRKPGFDDIVFGIGAGMFLLALSWPINLFEHWAFGPHANFWGTAVNTHRGILAYLLDIGQGAAVAPLSEEILFRGLLFTGLVQRMPAPLAAILSGVLFAVWHLQPYRLISVAITGIGLAYVYYWRRNLWSSIAAHGTINLILFSLQFFIRPAVH